MKIGIIGVGAMGCLFAGRLAAHADVVMVGHWPDQLTALRQEGLTLIDPDGTRVRHEVAVNAGDVQGANFDLALVLVKSYQTPRASVLAAQGLSVNGAALTLQNGLGNLEMVAEAVGAARATLGTTSEGATIIRPGVVQHAGHGLTHLAPTPATEAALTELARLLNQAGMVTHLTEDVDSLIWGKLAVNAGINPLTALLRVPNGFLAEDGAARKIMSEAAQEAAAVAAAQGIALPYADAAARALEVATATAANHSSMLQDVMRGAPTEIDAICGAIVNVGRRYGVAAPVNAELLRLVRQQSAALELPLVSSLPQLQLLLDRRQTV